MDTFTIAQAFVNLVPVAISTLLPRRYQPSAQFSGLSLLRGARPDRIQKLNSQYGPIATVFAVLRPEALDILDGIERVLEGHDTDANEFKQSVSSTLNMVAASSAFIAQVAITALSLDQVESVHWTAAAFFVTSLMSGLLAAYSAFIVLSKLNNMIGAQQLRAWLSLPSKPAGINHVGADSDGRGDSGALPISKNPSLAAAFVISSPNQLLIVSLGCLIVGTGIYFGCVYADNLGPGWGVVGSRAILVFYCITTAFGLSISSYPAMVKEVEVGIFQSGLVTANERGKENVQEMGIAYTDIEAGLDGSDSKRHQDSDLAVLSRSELDKMLQAYLQTQEESQRLVREIVLALRSSQLESRGKQ